MKKLILIVCILVLLGCINNLRTDTPVVSHVSQKQRITDYETNVNNTVFINTGETNGTGLLVRRSRGIFIWTAAHLFDERWRDNYDGEFNGYDDNIVVLRYYFKDGKMRSAETSIAKIICIGKKGEDPDVALLQVLNNFRRFYDVQGTIFYTGPTDITENIYHAGNFIGRSLPGLLTEGVATPVAIGQVDGRDELKTAWIPIARGSSGGGLFLQKNQYCIGIVNLTMDILPDGEPMRVCFYTPVEAMLKFAEKYEIRWALTRTDNKASRVIVR
jgi:hypothetical protein